MNKSQLKNFSLRILPVSRNIAVTVTAYYTNHCYEINMGGRFQCYYSIRFAFSLHTSLYRPSLLSYIGGQLGILLVLGIKSFFKIFGIENLLE